MPDERVQIEVGFDGGQIMIARVSPDSAEELQRALDAGDGTVTLDAEDGRYTLSVRRVVYVKRFVRESRVGFGAG